MPPTFDFIAIGDIVTDAFIRLKKDEADVSCPAGSPCLLSMRFGAKIPYESVTICPAVGNSPNAAVAAARLGLRSTLVSDLGKDAEGEKCLTTLNRESVATNLVRRHEKIKTNYHYVLWYGDDRTILIKHEDYPYALPALPETKWLYLSSLGEQSLPYHHQISTWLSAHPETKLAFQPGTHQIRFGHRALADIYRQTEVFFCNKDEAREILQSGSENVKELAQTLADCGPKIVVITDGIRGAATWDGKSFWQIPIYPDIAPPLDRTGAGDAFSSTVTIALALGLPLAEALTWGPINAMSVVQKIGAQEGLLSRAELEKYLTSALEDYQAKKIIG